LFGKRQKFAAIAESLQRDFDVYLTLVPLCAANGSITESGLVEQALDFVTRNTEPAAHIEGGQRIDRPVYPPAVLREVIVNALVHRNYSVAAPTSLSPFIRIGSISKARAGYRTRLPWRG